MHILNPIDFFVLIYICNGIMAFILLTENCCGEVRKCDKEREGIPKFEYIWFL